MNLNRRIHAVRKATAMIFLLLAVSLFHFHHPKPKPVDPYVTAIVDELQRVAARVGDYQHNPPLATSEKDDALYITRAELDLHIAVNTLNAYIAHQVTREDVRTAVEQLERDVEDEPEPANLKKS